MNKRNAALEEYSFKSISSEFNILFYICRISGIVPYDIAAYYQNKKFINSTIGIIWVLFAIVLNCGGYHWLMMKFAFSEKDNKSISDLTKIIGIVINYISPIMMSVDMILWIKNRQKIIDLIDEFNDLDANLFKQQIKINNKNIRIRSYILISIVFISEVGMAILMMFIFENINFLWLITVVPTLLNALDKIWFAAFLQGLKERFQSLNLYIDECVTEYIKLKKIRDNNDDIDDKNKIKNIGYLHKEILSRNYTSNLLLASRTDKRVAPVIPWEGQKKKHNKLTIIQSKHNILNDINNLEDKLNKLCQLHDELCELGKTLNGMWSIQMLLLMAYGFMSITAQFYFLYCSLTNQFVPALFQSSNDVALSCIFVTYVAAKCVYVIFLSWQTKLESRHTGVCVHKCAIAIDDNEAYEIINHISLKLLNHCVDFSACGFFNLDMTTLYGVTGAITSYLIILIQFNIAGQAVKGPPPTATVAASRK